MTKAFRYLVLGSGRMGEAAGYDLLRRTDTERVTFADADAGRLAALRKRFADSRASFVRCDAGNAEKLFPLMKRHDAVLSAVPYFLNLGLTRLAIGARAHFCDLGGNDPIVRRQLSLDRQAARAGVTVVPDCGLAPGMANLLAAGAIESLDRAVSVRIRVGGLPQKPVPPWNYQQVFSIHGLLNEYLEPARVLRRGKVARVEPLSGRETLRWPGLGTLEAFVTSGGTSTLPDTYAGRVDALDYKTIRFPGHCALLRTLRAHGFARTDKRPGRKPPRALLGEILEQVVPDSGPDQVLVRVTARGSRDGRRVRIETALHDRSDRRTGFSAMMRTTGFPLAVVARTLAAGRARRAGAVPQERALDPAAFAAECRRLGLAIRTTIRTS